MGTSLTEHSSESVHGHVRCFMYLLSLNFFYIVVGGGLLCVDCCIILSRAGTVLC
jgi:hypothetical protein